MAGAQFCAICGDIISDGCPVLDADGNETDEINYSPCQCDIAARQPDYTPVVGNDEELAKVFFVASDIGGWMIDLRPFEESTMATSRGPKWIEWDKKRNAERAELREKLITGIQAVRDALAARAVQVPVIPEGWKLTYLQPSGGADYEVMLMTTEHEVWDKRTKRVRANGATWQEALIVAIEQAEAKGGQE